MAEYIELDQANDQKIKKDYKELASLLGKRGLQNGSALGHHFGLYEEASIAITHLLDSIEAAMTQRDEAVHDRMMMEQRIAELVARAEQAERKRDAAVADLLRAEEAAEEANVILDNEVHPFCDYSLYLSLFDSVSDIVNWEYDDVWRNQKEVDHDQRSKTD